MSKPVKLSLTAEFYAAVEAFAKERNMKLATAIALLASVGYEEVTGKVSPVPTNQQGGWQGNPNSIEALMAYADRVTDFGANDPIHYVEDEDDSDT